MSSGSTIEYKPTIIRFREKNNITTYTVAWGQARSIIPSRALDKPLQATALLEGVSSISILLLYYFLLDLAAGIKKLPIIYIAPVTIVYRPRIHTNDTMVTTG